MSGYSLVYPECPCGVEGDTEALAVSEVADGGRGEVAGRECEVLRVRQSVGQARVSCHGQSRLTAWQTHLK